MAIRLSGLTSGLDTEALLSELVKAYSKKTEKYEKEQTKLSWKQESWKNLNAKIYSLYTNVGNLRYSSAYTIKKATISDQTKATVSASGDAITTSQKLNIISTAQSCYITGAKLAKSGVNNDTTLGELGYEGGESKIEILKEDGTSTSFKISKDTKVSDFTNALKENGLNASFDTTSGRFFVSAKETGAANDFTLAGSDSDGQKALKLLGLNVSVASKDENGNLSFNENGEYYKKYYAYFDTDYEGTRAKVDESVALYDSYKKAYDTANKNRSLAKNELSELKNERNAVQDKMDAINVIDRFTSQFPDADLENITQEELLDGTYGPLTTSDAELILNSYATYKELQADGVTKDDLQTQLDTYQEAVDAKQSEIDGYTQQMEENTANMANHPLSDLLQDAEGKQYNEDRRAVNLSQFAHKAVYANEVLNNGDYTEAGAVKVAGTDATIVLNGETYTQSSNSFTINGLTINAIATTGSGDNNAIVVGVATDAQAIYDKIKDFLTEYNSVINEMNKLYNADSARDYEPLTDEEKDAMSEKEIEKWENKIKDSLLRRDTTLNSVMTVMTNAMAKAYTINGKTYSLSSFGIKTLGYFNSAENENYAYHIDGDPDDEKVATNKDELMAAINEDPDSVVEFMKELTKNLYAEVDNKMKGTTLSSTYKVYNDKEMDKQYANYTKLISSWEKKVSEKEDYYYKKFTAMEKALAQMDSQTSALSGLIGSGN